MSAAVMTERLAETSPRFKARLAGLFCLLILPIRVLVTASFSVILSVRGLWSMPWRRSR